MRANGPRDTGPELALRRALRAGGVHGYRVDLRRVGAWRVPGRPDVAFVRERLAVFVHGCFWHRCPVCAKPLPKKDAAFWAEKFGSNMGRDARVRMELEAAGWTVLTFWEHELETAGGVERAVSIVRCYRERCRWGNMDR
jgi:DNA mismatch endonuclease (patch repair protein)